MKQRKETSENLSFNVTPIYSENPRFKKDIKHLHLIGISELFPIKNHFHLGIFSNFIVSLWPSSPLFLYSISQS